MIKIFFNHVPGNVHPVYQEILDNPLEGIEYINKNDFGRKYHNNVLNNIHFFSFFKYIFKKIYILPNITFKKLPGNIIYSCQSIPLFGEYILDLDCYEGLNRFSNKLSNNLLNKLIVKLLLKRQNCKKIIFWSDNAKIGFQSYLGNIFDSKIEVVYPAIKINHTLNDIFSWKDREKINILFVGRYFERKGGNILLEAFEKISNKHDNLYLNIISNVESKIENKYKDNVKIKFLGLLQRNEVIENFKKSDIYLMPTFNEIFGFVFLEAFAYGAVPISMDTFAINNIIDDGVDGYVIKYKNKFHNENYNFIDSYNGNIDILLEKIDNEEKTEIIKKIIEKLEFLINNKDVRKEFMLKGFEKVRNGKFNIDFRNKFIKNYF